MTDPRAHAAIDSRRPAKDNRDPGKARSFLSRWSRRSGLLVVGSAAFYVLCVVIGLLPVNNDFVTSPDGITIYVFSGAVHADLVLPVVTEIVDWRDHFPADHFGTATRHASHLQVGWGDRGFFLETPRWEDLKLSTAAHAILVPSSTLMHVAFTGRPRLSQQCRRVQISKAQYTRLVSFIQRSFRRGNQQQLQRVDFAYWTNDAFYDAVGSYHAFNTCNCWVGRALRHVGVRVALFTPLPRAVLFYLPADGVDS